MLSVSVAFILESELMNDVTKGVGVFILQVRNQVMDVLGVGQERAARGQMEVSDDFVDGDFSGDVASF